MTNELATTTRVRRGNIIVSEEEFERMEREDEVHQETVTGDVAQAIRKLTDLYLADCGASLAAKSVLLWAWNSNNALRNLHLLDGNNHNAAMIILGARRIDKTLIEEHCPIIHVLASPQRNAPAQDYFEECQNKHSIAMVQCEKSEDDLYDAYINLCVKKEELIPLDDLFENGAPEFLFEAAEIVDRIQTAAFEHSVDWESARDFVF